MVKTITVRRGNCSSRSSQIVSAGRPIRSASFTMTTFQPLPYKGISDAARKVSRTASAFCSPLAMVRTPPKSACSRSQPSAAARASAAVVLPVPVPPSKRKADGQGDLAKLRRTFTTRSWPHSPSRVIGRYRSGSDAAPRRACKGLRTFGAGVPVPLPRTRPHSFCQDSPVSVARAFRLSPRA